MTASKPRMSLRSRMNWHFTSFWDIRSMCSSSSDFCHSQAVANGIDTVEKSSNETCRDEGNSGSSKTSKLPSCCGTIQSWVGKRCLTEDASNALQIEKQYSITVEQRSRAAIILASFQDSTVVEQLLYYGLRWSVQTANDRIKTKGLPFPFLFGYPSQHACYQCCAFVHTNSIYHQSSQARPKRNFFWSAWSTSYVHTDLLGGARSTY